MAVHPSNDDGKLFCLEKLIYMFYVDHLCSFQFDILGLLYEFLVQFATSL